MTQLRPGLELIDVKKWTNKHENFTKRFSSPRSYKLRNPKQGEASIKRYNATSDNIKFLIQDAISHQVEIRAIGRGWSFTEISFGNNGFVDTLSLRLAMKLSIRNIHLDFSNRGLTSDDVRFFQCGNSILSINDLLERRLGAKRSIMASGASNGQTIAGATSTGTHGAAFRFGAVHDAIRGLHIITGQDSHVYIERKSHRVVSDTFIQAIGSPTHIVDDEAFNAAVVSFGSFGIIHGILLQTEPIFLLEKYRHRVSYNQSIKSALNTLDFNAFQLRSSGHAAAELYHIQVLINPYNLANNKKGVYITYMYKIPYVDRPSISLKDRGYTYGDDTLSVVAKLLSLVPIPLNRLAIKTAVNLIVRGQYPSGTSYPWIGTMGESFSYTSLKGKTASCAIGFDMSSTSRVLDYILEIIDQAIPFVGVIALRYVKGTKATLGFTRFPTTCVLEMDGVDTPRSRVFFDKVCEKLTAENISFTLHWGKLNDYLDQKPLSHFYPVSQIDSWKKIRTKLLPSAQQRAVFTNDFLRAILP